MESSANYITTSTIVSSYAGSSFPLNTFSNFAAYVALFDQYRFKKLEVWISPTCSQATPGAPEQGTWVSCTDLDNATPPASYGAVAAGQGSLQTSVLAGHYHKWTPAIAASVYGGAFGAYGSLTNTWVDCASAGVDQYGVKSAFSVSTTAIAFKIIVRALVEFRGITF